MRFAMFTYVSQEGSEQYASLDAETREAHRDEHIAWFAEHRDAVQGGHELAWPRRAGRVAADRQLVVLDGPFAESKEIVGGVIVLEAETLEDALGIAAGWPSLGLYAGARVEVVSIAGGGDEG